MANPNRGEVALKVGDLEYKLSFSINAICELEDAMDMPVAQIADRLNDTENIRMSLIRTVVWAALRDHHDDVSVKEAGHIASTVGVPAVMEAIGKAFMLAFPEAQGKANPQKAAKVG